MEGFILKVTKSIKEDLIVKVLTKSHFYTLYRFYGARHSIIYTGRKIDFEIEYQGVYMPKLRNIMHLSRDFERDINRVFIWQQFCTLLSKHLSENIDVPSFYFDLLDTHSRSLNRQNPKRVVIEMFLEILEFEGRLYNEKTCFLCGATLGENVALTQSFLLACPGCVLEPVILKKDKILELFSTKTLINITDVESTQIYEVILKGM